MTDITEIVSSMSSELGVDPENLSYIDQDLIDSHAQNGVETKARGHLTGNHFVANGNAWSWQDAPGSQCGQTQTWTYTRQPGATYGIASQCPQGYPWFNIFVP